VSAEIKVRDNGPYRVSGEFRLVDSQGREIDVTPHLKDGTIVLCRCGESKTKPFCDKSHATVCFRG
jgi:CDGSH iron-sulfur domain-containing protein 3